MSKQKSVTIMKNTRGMYEWAGWSDVQFCILAKYEGVAVGDVEYVLKLLIKQGKISQFDSTKYYNAITRFDAGEGITKHLEIIKELASKLGMRVIIRTMKKKTKEADG